jgi:hypothetical protein
MLFEKSVYNEHELHNFQSRLQYEHRDSNFI